MLTDLGQQLLPRIHRAAQWVTDKALSFELYVERWKRALDPGETGWFE